MQTSINLQNMYNYSVWPLLLVFLIFAIMTIGLIVILVKKNKRQVAVKKHDVKKIQQKNIKNIPVIKSKYIKKLNGIESKFKDKKIDLRKAYQEISETVRLFVFEVTDITTQNFSLSEIKKANIPGLYELIEEYYEPEFAEKSVGDFDDAINKARRIVSEWN